MTSPLRLIALSPLLVLLFSCNQSTDKDNKEEALPPINAIVDRIEVPITEDKLNNSKFVVKLRADSQVRYGVYDVEVSYNKNEAKGMFTMPKGITHIVPLISKNVSNYTCIIGFKMPDDTTFYPYFEVTGSNNNINMNYIRGYNFQ